MSFRSAIPVLVYCAFRLSPLAAAVDPPFQLSQWARPVPRHSVLAEPGYYVWGGSVVEDGGKYHMFYARWHTLPWSFGDGWLFDSEIAHAVADHPGGPFTPTGVVLGKRPNDPTMAFWDSQTQHNPHIRKFGGRFYLYYMASVDPGVAVWPGVTQRNRIQRNQRIGVVATDSIQDLLDGNFTRPSEPLVAPRYSTSAATDRTTNPSDYASNRIVNNQSVIELPDGRFQLICKSNWPQAPSYGHGRWLADSPAGPFVEQTGPILSDQGREDENHWRDPAAGSSFLLCKNFANNGTEMLESADASNWTSRGIQFGKMIQWADGASEALDALERPQILFNAAGRPVMLYMAARRALAGGAYEAFNVHIPLEPPTAAASAVPLASPAGIKTSGVLIRAVNLGSNHPATLNGLTFEAGGSSASALAAKYGFTQGGGATGAALAAGLVDTAYAGVAEFEDFLDTLALQSGSAQTGATLAFQLDGLTVGRLYRLQLFMGESRSTPSRHGPQLVKVGGQVSPVFDFGQSSALAGAGAQAVVVTVEFTATAAAMPVTAVQQVPSVGGLQLSAFAVHDVTPPANGSVTYPGDGPATVSWHVVPGFNYTVMRSPDLTSWSPAEGGVFHPNGPGVAVVSYTDPQPPPDRCFYRLEMAP